MDIKVYGTGCMRCNNLHKTVLNVLAELDVVANVQKVQDMAEITSAGVMSPPGLEINGDMKIVGRVPKLETVKELIKAEL
jgi:small redox-active disulfide protein 2